MERLNSNNENNNTNQPARRKLDFLLRVLVCIFELYGHRHFSLCLIHEHYVISVVESGRLHIEICLHVATNTASLLDVALMPERRSSVVL